MRFTKGIFAQRFGKIIVKPRTTRTTPERIAQKELGISIKSVEAFRTKVNTTTEAASEAIILKDFPEILFLPSVSDEPMIIGSKGRTQGARTVSTPAKIEMRRKNNINSLI